MVLIAERAIIDKICVMIVFNKAKYHICDNNEFASYLLRRTANAYARAYCSVNLFLFFTYFSMYSIRSIAIAWTDVPQDIYTHKHTRLQNTSHVYSGLAALILCPILLKHYCTIKYIVNQIKNANTL